MKKLNSLRKFLTGFIPELKRNPGNLTVSAERGTTASWDGPNLGFEYRFTASLLLVDYSADPDTVFIPLMLWIRDNEKALIQNADKADSAINFQVDIIDDKTVDIVITLPLTEAVDILRNDDGSGYEAVHRPEPAQIDAFLSGFEPLPGCEVLLKQIYTNGELLLPADE